MNSRPRPDRGRNLCYGVLLTVAVIAASIALASCASLGGGRVEVVRAEDLLTNSLSTYDAVMSWHKAHSLEETPAVYAILEEVRTTFPPAWRALDKAVQLYKDATTAAAKAALKTKLDEARAEVDRLSALMANRGGT